MGGNQESWARASEATDYGNSPTSFLARKTKGVTIGTYVQTDIPTAGDDLLDKMGAYDPTMLTAGASDFTLRYAIAHSQGGIVSRMADKKLLENWPVGDRRFYGLATFGTPHGGAEIINARDDGRLTSFTQDACETVFRIEIKELIYSKPLISFFVSGGTIDNTVSQICAVGTSVLPVVMSDLYAGSTLDFQLGAPVLGELNGFVNNGLHKAVFTGIEYAAGDVNTANPRQLFWRTMGSFNNTEALPTFTANADGSLVTWAATLRAEYVAKQQQAMLEAINISLFSPAPCTALDWALHPIQCALNNGAYWDQIHLSEAFQAGVEWLDDVDDQWKIIIGALDYEPSSVGTCICVQQSPNESPMVVYDANTSSSCTQYPNIHNEYIYCDWFEDSGAWVYKESDGIVPSESQEAFPGAVINDMRRMENTNHFQMRNSSETQKALTRLYNGIGVDGWFITPTQ